MSAFTTLLICMTVPAVLQWVYSRSAARKALVDQAAIVFPESKVVPLIRWGGWLLFSFAAVTSSVYQRSWLATTLFASFALISLFCRSVPVVITDEGVTGTSLWGRKTHIPWKDVASLEFNTGKSLTVVVSRDGTKVCHSGFHYDQARFEQEIKRRTGLLMKVIKPGVLKPTISYR